MGILALIIAWLIRWIKFRKEKIGLDLGRRLVWVFFFSIYLWYFTEMFLFLLINICFELEYQLHWVENVISFLFSFTGIEVLAFMMLFIPCYYWKYRKKKDVLENGKFRTLFDGLKLKWFWTALNIEWFLGRRVAYVVLIFVFWDVEGWTKFVPLLIVQAV